ncbi:MAG: prephenate dehydrogenase/arogenate dehydrogenase family protein [Nitrospirae bacterium]|nr:MAG: prephenate dehydrogenase/arogenate dehydrogenase family protein [Nitrospirota bacterium]
MTGSNKPDRHIAEMGIQFRRVVIIGVGLIGGSLGLLLKRKALAQSVVGVGRRFDNLELAVKMGAIDSYELVPQQAVTQADLVILATPVETYAAHLQAWGQSLPARSIVSDVGSVKGALVEQAEALLPDEVYFVGAHPIAGREKSGVAYASSDLFHGARCIITPTSKTNPHALMRVRQLWEAAGSVVTMMDPFDHDWILGAVSHLPHLAAFALMSTLQDLQESMPPRALNLFEYSGGGLRDTTRIAASSPEMWRDICLANRERLVPMIDAYVHRLEQLKECLQHVDGDTLHDLIHRAKVLREQLP